MGVLGDRLPSSSVSLLKKDDDAQLQPAPGTRGRGSVARGRESTARGTPLLPVTAPAQQQPQRRRRRALLLAAGTAALLLFFHKYGGATLAHFQPDALRATFEAQGPLGGVVLYVALFCTGELLHAPGLLFVAVGVLVWGRRIGWILAVFTAPLALITPFLLVRHLGGQSFLADMRIPLFKRIIERVDASPFSTVFLLRCFFFMSPATTVALAMSHVRLRTYILGSSLGLLVPVTLGVYFSESALTFLGYAVPDDTSTDAVAATVARAVWGQGAAGAIGALLESTDGGQLPVDASGVGDAERAPPWWGQAAALAKALSMRAQAVSKLAAATVVTS